MVVQEKGDTVFDMELSHHITGIQHINLKWQWRWRQNKSRSDVSDTLKNSSTFALRWTPCWMIGENSWCFTCATPCAMHSLHCTRNDNGECHSSSHVFANLPDQNSGALNNCFLTLRRSMLESRFGVCIV